MAIIYKDIHPVHEFLSNGKLFIPSFQRPYKWSVKNVVQLVEDIHRFKQTPAYRIGTVIIYEDEEGRWNIVDGQQRTITFLLMLRAIAVEKTDGINEDLIQKIDLINRKKFTPTFTSEWSKFNIKENYREIERRIASFDESFIEFFLEKCQVTILVINNISEAFQFFDSQNSRGKDLEPHDLLKAYHLRELKDERQSLSDAEVTKMVAKWEKVETSQLSTLFSDFLFRVRGWLKGNSSRYFTKNQITLFKGINLGSQEAGNYPYLSLYLLLNDNFKKNNSSVTFPFQLDQVIVNGELFFKMVRKYAILRNRLPKTLQQVNDSAGSIIDVLDTYPGRNRTGDKYVRMLFDCATLHFIDKFGKQKLPDAISKIFIWAYRPRLTYQSLQLASIDNYVVDEFNIFKIIQESIRPEQVIAMDIPVITKDYASEKTDAIKQLFIKLKYYSGAN